MTSKKNVQFLHPVLPFSVCVRMGPNWARDPPLLAPGHPNLGYQPPISIPFRISAKNCNAQVNVHRCLCVVAIPCKQVFKGHLTDIMSILVSRFL